MRHVIRLAKLFYGMTPLTLRKVAYDFATKNGIKHVFNKEKQLAGKDWLYLFIKRNPQISLRQPEGTSLNRISSFNAEEVKLFFPILRHYTQNIISLRIECIIAMKLVLPASQIKVEKFTQLVVQNKWELLHLPNEEKM